MSKGHPGYLKLLDEMRDLHVKKAADYGVGADPLANCRASAELGIPPWQGTMVRALDKVTRIKSFIANGKLENESVEDSLKDLAAYALIALVLFQEERKRCEPTEAERLVARPVAVPCYYCSATECDPHDSGCPRSRRPKPAPPRKRVYIAGPISKGPLEKNIRQACEAGMTLLKAGLAPLVPHLTCYMGQTFSEEYVFKQIGNLRFMAGVGRKDFGPEPQACPRGTVPADWYAADLPWVSVADAVLRLPGESTGADLEVGEALNRGIPVFTTVDEVIEWSKT